MSKPAESANVAVIVAEIVHAIYVSRMFET